MAVLTIFLVIAITFFVMHAIPASPFSSEKAKSDETIAALEAKYGFDKPVPVQFVNYLKNILRGDFGLSTKWIGSTVIELIMGGFGYSARLGLSAAAMAIVSGVILGALAGLKRGKWLDKVIQVVTTALVSMPSFVIATLLLIIFCLKLEWAPTMATQKGGMILPAVSLALYPMAYITRLMRSSMLETMRQDFIRTERSKGIPELVVIGKYAMKNSILPVVTYLGPMIAALMTGTFVVEKVFSIPGLGKYFVSAIGDRDYAVTLGLTIFVGAMIIFCNLLVDIIYAFVDPRVKIDK